MRKQLRENEENENPFAMSIGDLMAGLLFIFILLLTASIVCSFYHRMNRDGQCNE